MIKKLIDYLWYLIYLILKCRIFYYFLLKINKIIIIYNSEKAKKKEEEIKKNALPGWGIK